MAIVEPAWSAAQVDKNLAKPSSSSASVYYLVFEAADEAEAIAAVRACVGDTIPASYDYHPLNSISIDDRLAEDKWKVAVKYQDAEDNGSDTGSDDEEEVFSFDISTQTTKKVVPIKTVNKYAPSGKHIPDSEGINDGEGADIMTPVGHFSLSKSMSLSSTKRKKICEMVGTVNHSKFKGYSAGEVLYTGVSGTRTGKEKWRVTFNFAVQKNQSGIDVGSTIHNISKKGWELLWVRYRETEKTEGSTKSVVKTPVAAYVEQVYEEEDLGSLGVGN